MEYYITLPEKYSKPLKCNDEAQKYPVVILLGWINCKDKYLAKYAEIYEEMECITLRCSYPLNLLMFKHYQLIALAQKVLTILKQNSLEKNPIIFHVFSNGGCFLYQYILHAIKLQNLSLNIKGCTIDSAPSKITFNSVYRTITLVGLGPTFIRKLCGILAVLYMQLLYVLLDVFKFFGSDQLLSGDVWRNLTQAPNFPQLFIYSKNDEFVLCEDIEEFIELRRLKGVKVDIWRLEDSAHVGHLKTNRQKYVEKVSNFIKNCLHC